MKGNEIGNCVSLQSQTLRKGEETTESRNVQEAESKLCVSFVFHSLWRAVCLCLYVICTNFACSHSWDRIQWNQILFIKGLSLRLAVVGRFDYSLSFSGLLDWN